MSGLVNNLTSQTAKEYFKVYEVLMQSLCYTKQTRNDANNNDAKEIVRFLDVWEKTQKEEEKDHCNTYNEKSFKIIKNEKFN